MNPILSPHKLVGQVRNRFDFDLNDISKLFLTFLYFTGFRISGADIKLRFAICIFWIRYNPFKTIDKGLCIFYNLKIHVFDEN